MIKSRKINHQLSFTLLEIVLATILFTVGTVAVIKCITAGVDAIAFIESKAVAAHFAQYYMETYESIHYVDLVSSLSDCSTLTWAAATTTFGTYKYGMTLTDYTDYKKVDVCILWPFRGQDMKITLTHYFINSTPYY